MESQKMDSQVSSDYNQWVRGALVCGRVIVVRKKDWPKSLVKVMGYIEGETSATQHTHSSIRLGTREICPVLFSYTRPPSDAKTIF